MKKKKKSFFGSNFGYSNPSNMWNKLNNPTSETNKNRVDIINIQLTKLKNRVKNVPKNDRLKSEKNEKIMLLKKFLSLIMKID